MLKQAVQMDGPLGRPRKGLLGLETNVLFYRYSVLTVELKVVWLVEILLTRRDLDNVRLV